MAKNEIRYLNNNNNLFIIRKEKNLNYKLNLYFLTGYIFWDFWDCYVEHSNENKYKNLIKATKVNIKNLGNLTTVGSKLYQTIDREIKYQGSHFMLYYKGLIHLNCSVII